MGGDSLTAIVRERYLTGAYGGTHLRVALATVDELKANHPAMAPPPFPWNGPALSTLLGIPVVVDEEVPEHTWRLIDTATDAVLFEGDAR